MLRSGIVGTGALGSNLARSLHALGYPLHCIISRSITTKHALAVDTKAQHVIKPGAPIPPGLQQLFICTPDDHIASVAHSLADSYDSWQEVIVAHTSGALHSDVLAPLEKKGAHVMSFHPVQTFARDKHTGFKNIYIGIEGSPQATAAGTDLARHMQATPVILSPADKTMYHASAVVASNFMVTLSSMAIEMLEQIGLSRTAAHELLIPLIQKTSDNITSSLPEHVLTGPASRGDLSTITKHIEALDKHLPDYATVYKALTLQAIKLAAQGETLSSEQASFLSKGIST